MSINRPRLSFTQAIEAYLHYAPRLPSVAADAVPTKTDYVDNLLAIADQFDLIVFDAFGVLNSGPTAIPGAVKTIATLQSIGKKIAVVTNDASSSADAILARHRKRGFDFDNGNLISSQQFVAPLMKEHADITHWGAMAPADWPFHVLPDRVEPLAADRGLYDAVGGFLLIDSENWSDQQQEMLQQSLIDNPRPILVGNPDICAPMGKFLSVESGYFAHLAADACGVMPQCVGKPYHHVFEEVLRRHPDVDRNRVLMVGDTVHTDVLGGLASGIKTLLVHQGGFLDGQDIEDVFSRSGLRPHFCARAIGHGIADDEHAGAGQIASCGA
ncbi:MAG: HAD hydrolase-like protein [Thalassospira sp.]|uniref:HAD-IIA family hydrolase n=1 Tax=Thalassospira sp. TaxID=1912094 RepID=UPI0032EFE595